MAFGRKNKTYAERPWRPDFRDREALPDTKVIRTGFLLNFVAIALTVSVIVVYAFREYTLQVVSAEVAALEAQVGESSASNRVLLEMNKQFREAAAPMEESIAFDRQLISFPELVRDLSSIVPDGMIFNNLDLKPSEMKVGKNKIAPLLLEVSGRILPNGVESPSQMLADFQEALALLPSLDGRLLELELTRFNRNNDLGHFDFTLRVLIPSQSGA